MEIKHTTTLTINEIAARLGFGELNPVIRTEIYSLICERLNRQLAMKKNKKFGWNNYQAVARDLAGKEYKVAFDGARVQIRFTKYELIMRGSPNACRMMEEKIYCWLNKANQKNVLRDIRKQLGVTDRAAINEWRRNQREKMTARAAAN